VRIGAGLSTAADARAAAAEAALLAREPLIAATPTLAVLVTSPHHALHARGVLEVVREFAQPDVLVGCVAEAVVAGRREVEGEPAVVVWLAALAQPAETVHMEFLRTGPGGDLWAASSTAPAPNCICCFPTRTPSDAFAVRAPQRKAPGTPVMGGLVSGAAEPGLTGLFCEVGATVQFHVRDAVTADEDLRESLLRARVEGRPIGALLFTCNGRGTRMFDEPNHDAVIVSDLLGGVPVAGFFAAGELGPVGGKNFLHGSTASMALFVDD